MNGTFYIGATALEANQRALDVVANNIANINTPAYKRQEIRFSELVADGPSRLDAAPRLGAVAPLLGVAVDSSPRDFLQGQVQQTGRSTDLAIDGDGFVELMGPGGQALLWRGGSLEVNSDGYLATSSGVPLKTMISVPQGATNLAVAPDGKVMASVAGQPTPAVLGQIDLVMPKDPTSLQPMSGGFYRAASESDLVTTSPGQDGAGQFVSGALESSNVQLANEMVELLLLQRAYGASAQVVQAGDQLMSIANNLRR